MRHDTLMASSFFFLQIFTSLDRTIHMIVVKMNMIFSKLTLTFVLPAKTLMKLYSFRTTSCHSSLYYTLNTPLYSPQFSALSTVTVHNGSVPRPERCCCVLNLCGPPHYSILSKVDLTTRSTSRNVCERTNNGEKMNK